MYAQVGFIHHAVSGKAQHLPGLHWIARPQPGEQRHARVLRAKPLPVVDGDLRAQQSLASGFDDLAASHGPVLLADFALQIHRVMEPPQPRHGGALQPR